MVPDRGSRRKMLIEPEDKPSALASQLLPEKAACSCVSLALFRLARVFERPCTKTMGAAPTAVTVNAAGRSVLVIGSCPVRLNARTLAFEVLPGTPLRIALPTPFAWPVTTLKTGQTPGLLLLLYPSPSRLSLPAPLPAPRVEFTRQVANKAFRGSLLRILCPAQPSCTTWQQPVETTPAVISVR